MHRIARHWHVVNRRSLPAAVAVGLLALAVLLSARIALAQSYQPGQPVEYKAQSWPEQWARGVYLRDIPGTSQVLIRQAPTQFFPEGFERAYARSDVRPLTRAALASPVPAGPGAATPPRPRAVPTLPPNQTRGTALPANWRCRGPMSQGEVLGFLSGRLGSGDPFANPRREAVLQALREEILRCGVNFRYQAIGDFNNQIRRYGVVSNVTYALFNNFGPPAARSELMGNWRMMQVGATTSVTRGGRAYQRQEYAGLAGSLNISAGGTYVWNSPSGVLRGNWRPATQAEMSASDKGGEGVVLLNARSGGDWLVFRRTEEGPEGTGIMITDLATRNLRTRGTR